MADVTEVTEEVDNLDLDFGKKKKKKTKKAEEDQVVPAPPAAAAAEAEVPAEAPLGEEDDGLDFSDLKKKKKKKRTADEAAEGVVPEAGAEPKAAEADVSESIFTDELKKKKKLKKDYATWETELGEDVPNEDDSEGSDDDEEGGADNDDEDDGGIGFEGDAVEDPWAGSDRDYTYRELLDRAVRLMRKTNPEMAGEKRKYTMIPPQVLREGTKKTVFVNLADMCKRMHRQPEHVIQFLFAELGTHGSVDGSQRLVIKGRFQPKQIENVLRHYILEYVTCKICRSPDTILVKENRLMFVQCQTCNSQRSVAAIKSGFSAHIGRRKH